MALMIEIILFLLKINNHVEALFYKKATCFDRIYAHSSSI